MTASEKPRMRWATVDYRTRGDHPAIALANHGFWLRSTPRLTLRCRLLGHRPVVDGVDLPPKHGPSGRSAYGRRSRWAVCDRCGVRLQQPIDPDLEIGQPYTDPLLTASSPADDVTGARGVIGGQLVLGRSHDGCSVEVKIGHAGSEQTLAAHLHLHHLGALYLHTEWHGTWLQRRLIPTGHDSRVTGMRVADGRLTWTVWAKRDSSSRSDPPWMRGYVEIDPRTLLWGPMRYSHVSIGDGVPATVRMPHGDDHHVTLQLQSRVRGRAGLPRRAHQSWSVGWACPAGIDTESHGRGRVVGSGVEVSSNAALRGTWPAEATAAIACRLAADRARYGYAASAAAQP